MNERKARLVDGPIQQDWVQHGACVGSDVELFFPQRGQTGLAAKRICAVCPVRQQCLDYAVENREQHGIFGGMDRTERRAYARARRAA